LLLAWIADFFTERLDSLVRGLLS